MPFVVTRANVPISAQQEARLKERFGHAIESVPGKSEAGLLCGIDESAFLEHLEGGAAMEALEADMRYKDSLGIWALPAFLVENGEKAVLIRSVVDETMLEDAIDRVSG